MEAESNHQPRDLLHHNRPRSTGRQSVAGEIVEVQGGHIVRSTGRKDRHSKVCTAKGPRDRRVRLSAHTAIQFYDVQDRLGYDRPSKAVDWLIKNSKAAIDELAQLPPWLPTATTTTTADPIPASISAGKRTVQVGECSGYGFGGSSGSSFLPPSLESDAIADTIKFFFPVASAGATSAAQAGFHEYPPDLLSRSNSHAQDLRLSLQSFQDPMLLHQPPPASGEQTFFDANWGGGYVFSVPGGNCSPFDAQRGPLQSNNSPAVQAWTDPVAAAGSSTGFASGVFSGFRVPARIQGEEEHLGGGIAQKPPEASRRR